jgi:hypothetical protein
MDLLVLSANYQPTLPVHVRTRPGFSRTSTARRDYVLHSAPDSVSSTIFERDGFVRRLLRTRRRLGAAVVIAAVVMTAVTGMPYTAAGAPAGVRGAGTNDFTGDGRADLAALYDYGNGEAGLFVMPGQPEIRRNVTRFAPVYWTPPGNVWPHEMKLTSGNFNGDAHSDVLGIYRYSTGLGLFVFPGSPTLDSTTAATPYRISFLAGNFSIANMKITAGDFTGDGLSDVLLMHYLGVGETTLHVFAGTTSRNFDSGANYKIWHSPRYPGSFELPRAQIASADFTGDGRDDLLTLYHYGNAEYALSVWPGTASTSLNTIQPYWAWHALTSPFDLTNANVDTGDVTRDGRKDMVLVKNGTVYVIPGTTQGGENATWPYAYAYNSNLVGGKSVVGDFEGDGDADVMVLRDNDGAGSASVWLVDGGVPYPATPPVTEVLVTASGQFWPSVMTVA